MFLSIFAKFCTFLQNDFIILLIFAGLCVFLHAFCVLIFQAKKLCPTLGWPPNAPPLTLSACQYLADTPPPPLTCWCHTWSSPKKSRSSTECAGYWSCPALWEPLSDELVWISGWFEASWLSGSTLKECAITRMCVIPEELCNPPDLFFSRTLPVIFTSGCLQLHHAKPRGANFAYKCHLFFFRFKTKQKTEIPFFC